MTNKEDLDRRILGMAAGFYIPPDAKDGETTLLDFKLPELKQLISDIIDTIVPEKVDAGHLPFDRLEVLSHGKKIGYNQAIDTIHQNKKDLGL